MPKQLPLLARSLYTYLGAGIRGGVDRSGNSAAPKQITGHRNIVGRKA